MPNPFVRDADLEVYAYPARVRASTYSAEEVASLLERARAVAPNPDVLERRPPFFFRAEASNGNLDSYYTHMHSSSIGNYEVEYAEGRSFQNSHEWRALGFGYTVDARKYDGRGGGLVRVEVDSYTLPGLRLNSVPTDDLIDGIGGGLVRDVSIGFYGGEYLCDLCGRDMMRDWDCWHIPGLYYEIDAEEERARWREAVAVLLQVGTVLERAKPKSKKEVVEVLCTATIRNSHASELSSVYDGACPGATILKAQREAAEGRLREPRLRMLLEERYRMRLPEHNPVFAGAERREKEGAMPEGQEGSGGGAQNQPPSLADGVRGMLATAGIDAKDENPLTVAQRLLNEAALVPGLREQIETANKSIKELTPDAEAGKAYRAHLIEETCKAAVAANGNDYPVDGLRAMLGAQSDLNIIRGQRDFYAKQAAERLGQGRQTQDAPDAEKRRGADSNAGYAV